MDEIWHQYAESGSDIRAGPREATKSRQASPKHEDIPLQARPRQSPPLIPHHYQSDYQILGIGSPIPPPQIPPLHHYQSDYQTLGTGPPIPPPQIPQNNPTQIIDTTGQIAPPGARLNVTVTLWEDEGCLCFQVNAKGVCVARREDNHMINGTKLLSVAGIPQRRRDGILKSEKVRHVVKIGPIDLKGVWIPYERALELANRENIVGLLYPLFVYNIRGLLYHPSNQSRINAVVAASEQRRLEGQHVRTAPGTQPPDLTHHHTMSSPIGAHIMAHHYPTPSTSAASTITLGSQRSFYGRDGASNLWGSSSLSIDSGLRSARSTLTSMTSASPSPTRHLSEDPSSSFDSVPTLAESQFSSSKTITPRTTQRTASPLSHASNSSSYAPSSGGLGNLPESRVRRNQGNKPLSIDKGLGNSRSNPTTPVTTPPDALKPVKVKDGFSESPFEDLLNIGSQTPSHRNIQFALHALAENEPKKEQIVTEFQGEYGSKIPSINVENLSDLRDQFGGEHSSANSRESPVGACHHPLAGTDQSHDVGSTGFVEGDQNRTWSSKHHETKLSTEVRILLLHGEHSEDEGDALSQSATDQASTPTGNLTESNLCGGSSSLCSSVAQSQCSADDEDKPVIQLSIRKRELVDRLMVAFYAMFDPNSRLVNHAGPSSSSHQQSTSNRSDMSASAPGSGNGDRKRKASDNNFPTRDDDGDDDGKKRRRLSSSNPDVILETSKKFACPYFKRNPRKYQRVRSCPGPGWDTVHRLKEHLYRRHALPITCPRCCESFPSDTALRDHHKAIQSCEVRLEESIEGFDKNQEKKLKCRKKSSPAQSEEDRWRDIYRILFPEDESSEVLSPYYDYDLVFDRQNSNSPRSTGFAGYEEFLSRELPRQVRRELELALDQELEPIEDRLKSQLVDIVRTCQEKLFRLYQKSARNSPSTATGNGPEITHSDPPSSLSVPVQPSSSTISIDVDEQLAPYLVPPYSASDPWPQMDEDCNFPWQLLENNAISDSGYQSLDWLAKPPSDRSQDHNSTISTSEEVWNSLEITSEKIQSSQP